LSANAKSTCALLLPQIQLESDMHPAQVHPAALSSCIQLYDNLLQNLKEAVKKRKPSDVQHIINNACLPLAREDRLEAMHTDKQLFESNWKRKKSSNC